MKFSLVILIAALYGASCIGAAPVSVERRLASAELLCLDILGIQIHILGPGCPPQVAPPPAKAAAKAASSSLTTF
ncbi:hypothetical protein B0H34DRAFT_734824 [Crassisporium funariophilum]|nr:hypothetical protein B0H34DRAFT_734824 [Crassisporium funariophilum]